LKPKAFVETAYTCAVCQSYRYVARALQMPQNSSHAARRNALAAVIGVSNHIQNLSDVRVAANSGEAYQNIVRRVGRNVVVADT